MYWNVWKTYGENYYIKIFLLMPQENVNLKYSTNVELTETYLIAEQHF